MNIFTIINSKCLYKLTGYREYCFFLTNKSRSKLKLEYINGSSKFAYQMDSKLFLIDSLDESERNEAVCYFSLKRLSPIPIQSISIGNYYF